MQGPYVEYHTIKCTHFEVEKNKNKFPKIGFSSSLPPTSLNKLLNGNLMELVIP